MASKGESVPLRAAGRGPADSNLGGGSAGDDYDPHEHRQLPSPTNNVETLVHLVKCSLGTGILAMPQAFSRAGMVTGSLGLVLAGVLITHSLHVLVRAQYTACKQRREPLLSYPESMKTALEAGPACLHRLARPSMPLVDVFLVVYQLGICCVYIVFIASNVKKMLDPYHVISIEGYMAILLGPLVLFNLIPNLKILAPFSLLANVLMLAGVAIVLYYTIWGARPEHRFDEPLDMWGQLTTFPLFFGTALFALTAVGVVVALENNMATPRAFGKPCGVLNTGMGFIVVLYVTVGALGYNYCGGVCQDSITLNLPQGPLATAVILMFVVAVFISYVLHCYVPVAVVWSYVRRRLPADASPRKLRCAEYVLRVVLCLLTFVLAASVPRLGLFISLFGALCLSALGLCFPAIMEACFSYPHQTARRRLLLLKDVLLFVVGLVGLVAGTYTAIKAIVESFQVPAPTPAPSRLSESFSSPFPSPSPLA